MRLGIVLALSLVVAGPAAAQPALERGKYLVEVLGACGNCHSPKQPGGEVPGKHLAGGFEIKESFYAGKIARRDLQASIAYLRSAKPVKNAVRPPEPAKPPAH